MLSINLRLLATRCRKEGRCNSLLQNLQHTGLAVDLITVEIACPGHFKPETISQVAKACQVAKKSVQALFEQGAHTAVSCSYRIFNARTPPVWDLSDLLK